MTPLGVWLVSLIPAWAGFLLGFRWLGHLPDGGWAFARVLGLVLWALAVAFPWSLGVWSFSRAVALAVGALLVVLAAGAALRERPALTRFFAARRAVVFATEAVFVASVAFFSILAAQHPDVHPGGHERFQDFALVQAVARSGGFPVEDPWFAGEPLAYYFFGHALVALAQVAGNFDPFAFFNLALVVVHASFATSAFGLGLALTGRRRWGAVATFLVVACGTFWPLVPRAWETGWKPIDWFGAARAIEGAVTEFPAFVILYADLHAHVIALPVFVVSLALPWAWMSRESRSDGFLAFLDPLAVLVLGGLLSGALLATNPLDGGTAIAVWIAAGVARALRPGTVPATALAGVAASVVVVSVTAGIVAAPFLTAVLGTSRSLRLVEEGSPWVQLLTHFGLPLALFAAGAAGLLWRGRGRAPVFAAVGLGAIVLAAGLVALPAFFLGGLLLAVAGLVLASRGETEVSWAGAVAFTAVALLLACELVYVEATYGPSDLGRTVSTSKLYLQAWVMLGVAVVPLLASLAGTGSALAAFALAGAFVFGGQYPVLATLSRTYFLGGPWTLDATGVLERNRPGDARAVRWLREQPGRPVVLEAAGDPYTWAGRIATLSGAVAPLGWTYHEASWRNSWDVVRERQAAVEAIYAGTIDREAIEATLDRLGVDYVVVGALERERYPAEGLERLVAPYPKVFEADGTALYRRARP